MDATYSTEKKAADPDLKAFVHDTRKSLAESSANFNANAILRGAQLTVVGGSVLPSFRDRC